MSRLPADLRGSQFNQRVGQFRRYLELMSYRAHEIAHGPCYLIFEAPVWKAGRIAERFVQFSLERSCFHLDMPAVTLSRPEAAEIRTYSSRFFYLSERPYFRLHDEDIDGHDPFRAIYLYGEEPAAARDMAFIFTSAWQVPLETVFSVSSAAFNGRFEWERAQPLESLL